MNKKQNLFSRVASSTNQFSRILPKKMHHDKEHLYSQMLQLKQNLNQTAEENIRLKTKISILQKEKTKINKYFQGNHDLSSSKGNSRLNLLGSRAHDKENLIMMNLKKMVRESNQLNDFLKSQNQKIKKHIKYTKVNEMQIEKKVLYDENKQLSSLIAEYNDRFIDQEQLSGQNSELKKFLEEEIQENKILNQQNERYEELLENLKKQFQVQIEKLINKEKKLTRDLALEKRKANEQHRCIENLRIQIKNLQNNQAIEAKKKQPAKTFNRPTSSIPYRRPETAVPHNVKPQAPSARIVKLQGNQKSLLSVSEDEIQKKQTEKIKLRNQQLQKQLKQINSKLNKNQRDFHKIKDSKQPEQQAIKQNNIPSNQKIRNKIQIQDKKQITNQSEIYKNQFQDEPVKTSNLKGDAKRKAKQQEEEANYLKQFEQEQKDQDYEQIFEKKSDLMEFDHDGLKRQIRKSVLQQKHQEKDSQEQVLYKKEYQKVHQEPNEKKKKKKNADKNEGNQKKKEKKSEKTADKKTDDKYKPDKKTLAQIKQLLTYRMKAQRYPFAELKNDIQSSQTSQFTYLDLSDMLINQPFYLTPEYAKKLLQYCYEKEDIQKSEILNSSKLLEKLRKVIEQFELIDEEQQKQMIVRIAQMTSTYPEQLQSAFQQIKNGQQTVSKASLVQMFQKLQLEPKFIELIIAELSLCSTDIQHLNYYGFFQRFYLDGQEEPDTHPIQEQEESQQSFRQHDKNKKAKGKKQVSEDDDDEYAIKNYKMNEGNMVQKPATYVDDEDIVSDDGRI